MKTLFTIALLVFVWLGFMACEKEITKLEPLYKAKESTKPILYFRTDDSSLLTHDTIAGTNQSFYTDLVVRQPIGNLKSVEFYLDSILIESFSPIGPVFQDEFSISKKKGFENIYKWIATNELGESDSICIKIKSGTILSNEQLVHDDIYLGVPEIPGFKKILAYDLLLNKSIEYPSEDFQARADIIYTSEYVDGKYIKCLHSGEGNYSKFVKLDDFYFYNHLPTEVYKMLYEQKNPQEEVCNIKEYSSYIGKLRNSDTYCFLYIYNTSDNANLFYFNYLLFK